MDFNPSGAESTATIIDQSLTVTVPAGHFYEYLTPAGVGFDMRAYGSFYLNASFASVNGVDTGMPGYRIQLGWLTEPALGLVFADTVGLIANSFNANFPCYFGDHSYADVCRGPYLTITIFNDSALDMTGGISLVGTSRILPNPTLRSIQFSPPGGSAASNVDSTMTQAGIPLYLHNQAVPSGPIYSGLGASTGNHQFIVTNSGAVALNWHLDFVRPSNGVMTAWTQNYQVAAATTTVTTLFLPKMQTIMEMDGNAAATTVSVLVTALSDRTMNG